MLGRYTLARMKKKENTLGQKEKNKMDKKDDVTIVLFSFYIFLIILFGLPP
jgi:hypothetical protein